jgi:hypothetical protein
MPEGVFKPFLELSSAVILYADNYQLQYQIFSLFFLKAGFSDCVNVSEVIYYKLTRLDFSAKS